MLDRLTGLPLHRFFYVTALILLGIGVCLNKVVMSVGTIMLISSWVLEGDFRSKFQRIKRSLPFFIGISLFSLHLLGLLWTSDFAYGFHDIRSKLPLLVIPFVLGSIKPINKLEFKLILYFFVASVFTTSLLNYGLAKGFISSDQVFNDFRDYSFFISHIRFSLMIDFAIFILIYMLIKEFKKNYFWIPILLWFLYYTYFSQIISGFIYLFLLSFIAVIYVVLKSRNTYLKLGVTAIVLIGITTTFFWINTVITSFYETPIQSKENPDTLTVNGRPYQNDESSNIRENGQLIYWYACPYEIEKAWNSASNIDYLTGLDINGFPIRYTLYRYMASIGLRKDSLGFTKMTTLDIENVQKGITNPNLLKKGMEFRIIGLLNEYEQWKNNDDPNNKTLMQRFSYWSAGWNLFLKNPVFGVGTGDIQQKFDRYYEETNSPLEKENRHRSHNQFLSFAVSFGIFGSLIFLVYLAYPFYYHRGKVEFLFVIFMCLMVFSFLPEDTLETQSGISFFALFYSLFLFRERS